MISANVMETLRGVVDRPAYPLIFATVSGAHLYGFPSPDSDYDLRGVHVLPTEQALGLMPLDETREMSRDEGGLLLDLVTHDAAKFFKLMLKRNGYVLEQLFSPLVVLTTPAHAELKAIATGCITKHHSHHYLGFAETQWRLFEKTRTVKSLLYTYRVLLTGIHLMRTGEVQADLPALNENAGLTRVADLIARKTTGAEKGELSEREWVGHEQEYARLLELLRAESDRSPLPESPTARPALSDLLVRLRLNAAAILTPSPARGSDGFAPKP